MCSKSLKNVTKLVCAWKNTCDKFLTVFGTKECKTASPMPTAIYGTAAVYMCDKAAGF